MKQISVHHVRNLGVFVFLSILVVVVYVMNPAFFSSLRVQAGTTENISGWVWMNTPQSSGSPQSGLDQGLGWVSFNSTDCDPDQNGYTDTICGGDNTTTASANYGVNLDTTNKSSGGTGNFSGAAWGENVGWVSFNRADTGNPPEAPFNSGVGPIAQVNWATGKVTGWMRVLSGDSGWDGWIKLSDDAVPSWSGKGVKIAATPSADYAFSGYAWGSDVVGWVDFGVTIGNVPVGPHIAGEESLCTIADVDASGTWGNCQALSQCVAPPATQNNVPGVQVGTCLDSNGNPIGSVVRACTILVQTCSATAGGSCGDGVCDAGETTASCPADCKVKPRFWQF